MHRIIFSALFCTAAVLAAPQDSGITYVKINPVIKDDPEPAVTQIRESRIENIPLTIPGPKDNNRKERSEPTTSFYEDITETPELVTEIDELTTIPEILTVLQPKLPAPRLNSKLSYYKKSNQFNNYFSTNLIDDRSGKRRFRSKCRCSKLTNCPKLQITVPRCPEDYFMCCF